jgi:acyl-CoA thioester hydrolase
MFSLDFSVRDYECDLQGIVNNAIYLHYLEHARHEFLKSRGVDFAALHERGIDPVVVRVEIDYKTSLRSGDRFSVSVATQRQGRLRLVFRQRVTRADGVLAAEASVYGVLTRAGRPVPADELAERLAGAQARPAEAVPALGTPVPEALD